MHYKQKAIENEWIIEANNKLARRVSIEEIHAGWKLSEERTELAEVKIMILAMECAWIADKVND